MKKLWLGAVATGVAAAALLARRREADLEGQVVLITGGSRGLGLALAREFARRGCRIAICARDERDLERARLSIEPGSEVFATCCDVTDPESVRDMVEAVRARYGRIDILVNNAGQIVVAPIENLTIENFERAMEVMFWGVVYPTLEVLPEMRARGAGRIATITSIGGKVSVPHLLPYCCAKFAAVGFCEGLRTELGRSGIQVTTVVPGLMRTGSYLKAQFKGNHEAEAAWFSLAATNPLTSMSAERSARQIVSAIRRGQSEKILTMQANVLARVSGAFPGLMPRLLSAVERMLPRPTADPESEMTGAQLTEHAGRWFRAARAMGRGPALRFNQMR